MVEWGVKKELNEREAVSFAYFNLIPGSHEICIPHLIITQFKICFIITQSLYSDIFAMEDVELRFPQN